MASGERTTVPPRAGSGWLRPVCWALGHAERYTPWHANARGWARFMDCTRCGAFVAEAVYAPAGRPLDINPPRIRRLA